MPYTLPRAVTLSVLPELPEEDGEVLVNIRAPAQPDIVMRNTVARSAVVHSAHSRALLEKWRTVYAGHEAAHASDKKRKEQIPYKTTAADLGIDTLLRSHSMIPATVMASGMPVPVVSQHRGLALKDVIGLSPVLDSLRQSAAVFHVLQVGGNGLSACYVIRWAGHAHGGRGAWEQLGGHGQVSPPLDDGLGSLLGKYADARMHAFVDVYSSTTYQQYIGAQMLRLMGYSASNDVLVASEHISEMLGSASPDSVQQLLRPDEYSPWRQGVHDKYPPYHVMLTAQFANMTVTAFWAKSQGGLCFVCQGPEGAGFRKMTPSAFIKQAFSQIKNGASGPATTISLKQVAIPRYLIGKIVAVLAHTAVSETDLPIFARLHGNGIDTQCHTDFVQLERLISATGLAVSVARYALNSSSASELSEVIKQATGDVVLLAQCAGESVSFAFKARSHAPRTGKNLHNPTDNSTMAVDQVLETVVAHQSSEVTLLFNSQVGRPADTRTPLPDALQTSLSRIQEAVLNLQCLITTETFNRYLYQTYGTRPLEMTPRMVAQCVTALQADPVASMTMRPLRAVYSASSSDVVSFNDELTTLLFYRKNGVMQTASFVLDADNELGFVSPHTGTVWDMEDLTEAIQEEGWLDEGPLEQLCFVPESS